MKKIKRLLAVMVPVLFLSGCSSAAPTSTTDGTAWDESWFQIGTTMGVEEPEQLTLLESKETLAADGLYYATWVTGDPVPYENSDGETVDLYDAQLYLLVSECSQESDAQSNCDIWLAAAKENYEILSEETVICGDQSYNVISYRFADADVPYDRGVSAFAVIGTDAVCAELTCVETYEGNLDSLLNGFLEGCHYSAS